MGFFDNLDWTWIAETATGLGGGMVIFALCGLLPMYLILYFVSHIVDRNSNDDDYVEDED